ncbi:MAG: acyl-CoA dehydrogenase [Alphaproteobacteria bacterium]|nr:acyl-CoA dehydrogenase [Alphaproteobacteria bacterium]
MSTYNAPLRDMRFVLDELGLLSQLTDLPAAEEVNGDLVAAVFDEGEKLAREVIAPLNAVGDQQGATYENGVVRTADGFADAYRAFVDGGWASVPFDPDHGGQGLPWLVTAGLMEMWIAANTAWALCPILTMGAVELLGEHGSAEQKSRYLPKMVSGEWTGTMNLTEPQAGSDLGALRCRAEPDGDHYRIKGQKIFITYGEHDLTENIIHMVLARTPDAPEGNRGISLFLVPKFMVDADGSLGQRNDLRCISLEHKLGIHASPTCVMAYGENDGAIGYLVGKENEGLRCMFTMMNNARMNIGISGLAIAERAYQQARDYARERVQFGAIIHHPDIRRMLMTMKAQIEAMRALAYDAAATLDRAKHHPDDDTRRLAQARIDLITPVTKAWCTDTGVELASIGVQIHGGMGFIEETGAAQHYRDARIAPIYEGTNGIQAIDLVTRKVLRDGGDGARAYIAELRETRQAMAGASVGPAGSLAGRLDDGIAALESATDWILAQKDGPDRALAGANAYLTLFGIVAGGGMMAKSALVAAEAGKSANGDAGFYEAKLATAAFYGDHILPRAMALATAITQGAESVLAIDEQYL